MVDTDGIIAGDIAQDFRGWSVFRSYNDSGRPDGWYANRLGDLEDVEMYNGLARTVGADTPAELRVELMTQAHAEADIEDARREGRELEYGPAVWAQAA